MMEESTEGMRLIYYFYCTHSYGIDMIVNVMLHL